MAHAKAYLRYAAYEALDGYALYFYKGLWKESASVKNEDIERLNKGVIQ